MDPYHNSQLSSSSSPFLPAAFDIDDPSDPSQSQMKAPKRKRLAKACDACHKSKRRCDGTAPCSNCFYAVKPCTYTDASGRPVPAPRPFKQDRPDNDQRNQASSSSSLPTPLDRTHPEDDGRIPQNSTPTQPNIPRKRFRNDRGNPIPAEDISPSLPLPIVDPLPAPVDRPAPLELDHSLTRELTNLFFAHCHPARVIIHKPTFTANLAHNRVPTHLLHAVCALAAPLSKQPRLRTSPSRFAGQPFAEEALSLMFDGAGRLICERNLATCQALCLLHIHDLKDRDQTLALGARYRDLAMQVVESLNLYQPDYPTLTPVPSAEFIQASIEREAVRRIFWLLHFTDIMTNIYFKTPVAVLPTYGMRLRLPVDETSFELGVHSTLPEYLYLPAVRTQYASEFGHLIRVITIYAKVENVLHHELNDPDPSSNASEHLLEAEQLMDAWAGSLPEHLRFSEQSLQVQQSMFETSSNGGAWCWCCMHVYHASIILALSTARQQLQRGIKSEQSSWALRTLELIMEMLGDRAKNSILMGSSLWSLIRYCGRDGPQIRAWCSEYEDTWGTRIREIALDRYNSPPMQHQWPPSSLPQHNQPPPLRRGPDSRNPPTSSIRPSTHQHDSSFNRRSGSSSPTTLAVGRPLEELRMYGDDSNHNNHNRNPHNMDSSRPDRDVAARVHSGSGSTATGIGVGQGGNGMKREREQEGNIHSHQLPHASHSRRPGHEATIDPIRSGENTNTSAEQGVTRGGGNSFSGDGSQSLPSLKSVGLLGVHNHVSMPVGLPWLANESR